MFCTDPESTPCCRRWLLEQLVEHHAASAHGVTKRSGAGLETVTALNNVMVTVPAGRFVTVRDPSGGKPTQPCATPVAHVADQPLGRTTSDDASRRRGATLTSPTEFTFIQASLRPGV